jgi:hypothetical protein
MRTKDLAVCSLLVVSLATTAQQPLRPPQIAPFGDSEWWVLTDALPARIGQSQEVITVPKGFVTDLASIPRFFWSAFPKTGRYMSAAILHDYLYWDQRCTRTEADRIFDIEMMSYGVDNTSRKLIFAAVSDFGSSAWQSNTASKASGEPRYLPEAMLAEYLSKPFDASRTWPAVRQGIDRLSNPPAGSHSDPNPQLAATCIRAVNANPDR